MEKPILLAAPAVSSALLEAQEEWRCLLNLIKQNLRQWYLVFL
jgi:hypothetical protein